MFIVSKATHDSWTAMSTVPHVTQEFNVRGVLFASGSAFVAPTASVSGSYHTPVSTKFVQLKDANGVVFYTKRINLADPLYATPALFVQPLKVTLPISYYTNNDKATIVVFGDYSN